MRAQQNPILSTFRAQFLCLRRGNAISLHSSNSNVNAAGMQYDRDEPGVPLQNLDNRNQRQLEDVAERDGYKDFEKIDVHNFTGLATILAVNVQQLYLLISVGPDLGPMFYVLISITSISAIFVIFLLPIRLVLEACKKIKDRRTWAILYYTSLVLNVLIFVLNLVLQIFDQTTEKCQVLLSQPLPVAARDEPK